MCRIDLLGPYSRIGIVLVIPGNDRRIVFAFATSVQVDSDDRISEGFFACRIGFNVFFRIFIIEFIIVILVLPYGFRVLIVVDRDIPEQGVDPVVDPLDLIAVLETLIK